MFYSKKKKTKVKTKQKPKKSVREKLQIFPGPSSTLVRPKFSSIVDGQD